MEQLKFIMVGGNSGIGLEIANQLASMGHIVHCLNRGSLKFESTHQNLIWHRSDILDHSTELPEIEGSVDGLIYCPGSINLKPFRLLKEIDFTNDLNINLMGAVRVIQKYLPVLQMSVSASIILFSTVAVQTGMTFHASVAAAKGAVEGFGRALAAELAPSIRVNVIAPSLTNTPLADKLINNEAKLKVAAERHPLKRIGIPEEVASLAVYLLSRQASWITGQVIKIDGGISTLK